MYTYRIAVTFYGLPADFYTILSTSRNMDYYLSISMPAESCGSGIIPSEEYRYPADVASRPIRGARGI